MSNERYVDVAVGDDANAGTAPGAGNAWATIQHAINNLPHLTVVWIKASGIYEEAVTISGSSFGHFKTVAQHCQLAGYETFTGDNGQVIMSGGGGRTSAFSGTVGGVGVSFANFKWVDYTGGTNSYGMYHPNGDRVQLRNIEISGCTKGAVYGDGYWTLIACDIHDNGDGTRAAVHCDDVNASHCKIYDNVGGGIRTQGQDANYGLNWFHNCLFARNTAYQISYGLYGFGGQITDCTIDGGNVAGTIGIHFGDTSITYGPMIVNNIIYSCATGVSMADNTIPAELLVSEIEMSNLFYGNTEDYSYQWGYNSPYSGMIVFAGKSGAPANNIYGQDPLFVDRANNDYTLSVGSPAISAGTDCSHAFNGGSAATYTDIGAFKTQPSGGDAAGEAVVRAIYAG